MWSHGSKVGMTRFTCSGRKAEPYQNVMGGVKKCLQWWMCKTRPGLSETWELKNKSETKQRRNILRGVRLEIFSRYFHWQLFELSWLNTGRAEESTLTCLSSLKTAVGPRVLLTLGFLRKLRSSLNEGSQRCRISRRAEPRDVEAQIGESRFLTRSMSSTDEGRVLCLAQMRSASKNSGYLGNPNGTPENLGEDVRISGTTDNYFDILNRS